jgi:hypothetical protein
MVGETGIWTEISAFLTKIIRREDGELGLGRQRWLALFNDMRGGGIFKWGKKDAKGLRGYA